MCRAIGRRRRRRLARVLRNLGDRPPPSPGRTARTRRARCTPGSRQQAAGPVRGDSPYTHTVMPHWILALRSKKRSRVTRQRADHRNGQEHVDRDEDREQVEAAGQPTRHVLQRQHDEKRQDQAAVVTPARGLHQGDVFAQRQERHRAKQQCGAHRARAIQASPEHRGADPQRPQVPLEAVDACAWPAACCARAWPNTAHRRCRSPGPAARTAPRRAGPPARPRSSSATWHGCLSRPVRPGASAAGAPSGRRATTACPRTDEEGALVFALGCSCQRGAESHGAQDGHRHHLALGHHALHVVDPGRG